MEGRLMAKTKEHAHELIDRMAPGQVAVVVDLLEIILDPVGRSLANAPFEDEPISEEEAHAVAASKIWLKNNQSIPHETVLTELGLSAEDFERLGRTPLDPRGSGK
jgi:hypothetical protein